MKRAPFILFTIALALTSVLVTSGQESSPSASSRAAAALGAAVQRLLETSNVTEFATAMVANTNDWAGARTTNDVAHTSKPAPFSDASVARERQQISRSAQLLLDSAARMGINGSRIRFRVVEVKAPPVDQPQIYPISIDHTALAFTNEMLVTLHGESADPRFTGDYQISADGALGFSSGWKIYQGVRWVALPPGVVDPGFQREMKALEKIASGTGRLNETDDPALADLGNALIKFLRERDSTALIEKNLPSFDLLWNNVQESARNAPKAPSRGELLQAFDDFARHAKDSADAILAQASTLGIDFSNATVTLKHVEASNPYQRETYGTLVGIDVSQAQFTFAVQSDQKSKSGQPIAGDYVIAAGRTMREAGGWKLMDQIRWAKFPDGLLDAAGQKSLTFENFVNETHSLPPGTLAPDIEFTRLADGSTAHLASLRGKVLVLDFWSTTCGPCQEPLADLQTLPPLHPEWKDKVAIMTVSIDEEFKQARDHLNKHGWTNTFNTWAGPGGFDSATAKQFRVTAIPTEYLISPDGRIFSTTPRDAPTIEKMVNAVLGK